MIAACTDKKRLDPEAETEMRLPGASPPGTVGAPLFSAYVKLVDTSSPRTVPFTEEKVTRKRTGRKLKRKSKHLGEAKRWSGLRWRPFRIAKQIRMAR